MQTKKNVTNVNNVVPIRSPLGMGSISDPRRRNHPRIKLGFQAFWGGPRRMLFADRGDLSLGGVFLPTPVPDRPGQNATLRVKLPGRISMLKIPAKVIWANGNRRAGELGMGLKFTEIDPWQEKELADVIADAEQQTPKVLPHFLNVDSSAWVWDPTPHKPVWDEIPTCMEQEFVNELAAFSPGLVACWGKENTQNRDIVTALESYLLKLAS